MANYRTQFSITREKDAYKFINTEYNKLILDKKNPATIYYMYTDYLEKNGVYPEKGHLALIAMLLDYKKEWGMIKYDELRKAIDEKKAKKIYALHSELTFGKFKGQTISKVLDENPQYLLWCIENLKDFKVSQEVERLILK